MNIVDKVYDMLCKLEKTMPEGVSASDISAALNIDRSNASRYLNILHKENRVDKIQGRPVLYKSTSKNLSHQLESDTYSLDKMVGATSSLAVSIQKAKAAVLYPPRGLHTLILGETGVGKSMFAELMYRFSIESKVLKEGAPFIRFNCADYADNPNLLTAQIFGVKKGAYTGADANRDGLLKMAHNGFLFLDEVHRLSPQGQEMLFTYIDKGFFRPLGATDTVEYANVRIIAATTESPQSYLLRTFTRRIPMVITLPPLRDRSLIERYALIETFIKEESLRVNKSIYINKNSLIAYLLYDCPNNIGQLKSDIQLACAKAFLNYKSSNDNYILISQSDLPSHVIKGLMKIKYHRKEIEQILSNTDDILKFSQDKKDNLYISVEYSNDEDFYSSIEKKLESLKNLGIDEKEANEILNIDIETRFQKYIGNISDKFRKEELSKVVDMEVLEIVEEILLLAKQSLKKEFDEKIYSGLALHLERSIERIRRGEKIYNPKLNFIRVNYEDEFLFATKIAKLIDNKFSIEIPIDEIGYLAMFFTTSSFNIDIEEKGKVKILVIMHGKATASSMVDVANSLIGEEYAEALDMPLSMKPETMYEIAKRKILEIDEGKGAIILVDMGSLVSFGDMIMDDTGIECRTIDMVSTPLVIDACRKAIMGYELNEIYDSIVEKNFQPTEKIAKKDNRKSNAIVTACFTGEGSSKRLISVIKDKIKNESQIKLIPINILDNISFKKRINELEKRYNILAVVSTIDIDTGHIPFISAIEILNGGGINKIKEILKEEDIFFKIGKSLNDHMVNVQGEEVADKVKVVIRNIEKVLDLKISSDVKMGIALHMGFLVDNILNGVEAKSFENLDEYKALHRKEFSQIRKCLELLEKSYNITIEESELAHIVKLFLLNNGSV